MGQSGAIKSSALKKKLDSKIDDEGSWIEKGSSLNEEKFSFENEPISYHMSQS